MSPQTPKNQAEELDHCSDHPHAPTLSTLRACESCRARKIRCDRKYPCSHCVHSKISCTRVDNRPKERRTRVHISGQYERKIDSIDSRINEITGILREIKASKFGPVFDRPVKKETDGMQSAEPFVRIPPISADHITPLASDSPTIEAESSMDLHSIFSQSFLQEIIQTPSSDESPRLLATINSLHQVINNLKDQAAVLETSYTMANLIAFPKLNNLKLPPIQKAISGIRRAKADRESFGAWISGVLHIDELLRVCIDVYISRDYSMADFIIANAGMHSIFWEMANSDVKTRNEYLTYVGLCQKNLETALSTLPLHLPATLTMINALLLGAFHAVEISKPSLSWVLTSKAAELCITLGYNRLPRNIAPDDRDHELKLYLFWSVYYMDKSLSLRLGRASNMSDWDLTTTMPTKENFSTLPHSTFIYQWIKTARCQGRIYEKLYSADALMQPDFERRYRVDSIAKDIEEIRGSTDEAQWSSKTDGKLGTDIVRFFYVSDDVLRLSLLTLALRASPPPAESRTTFIPECVKAARETLQRHQDCMNLVQTSHPLLFSSYVHWTLLFSPFVPFIVLFCQVIETHDKADLASLDAFITSTESAPAVSDAAAKMYRLFQVLHRVAHQYVEYQESVSPVDHSMENEELNNYLTSIGLLPLRMEQDTLDPNDTQTSFPSNCLDDSAALNTTNSQRGANAMLWMSNTAQLEDWFQNNHQMMESVEDTTFNFTL